MTEWPKAHVTRRLKVLIKKIFADDDKKRHTAYIGTLHTGLDIKFQVQKKKKQVSSLTKKKYYKVVTEK